MTFLMIFGWCMAGSLLATTHLQRREIKALRKSLNELRRQPGERGLGA